jgi:hypothetical protein
MEVHAHTHTPRKKWTHYLFEFLMLFLAVFCGFLAENQREHMVEHQREKKFAQQLLNDLRKDSAFYIKFSGRIQNSAKESKKLKQLLLRRPVAPDKDIMNGFLSIYWVYDLQLTSTTFTQMKTSGSLRYIRNEEITTALQEYYDVLVKRSLMAADVGMKFVDDYMHPFYMTHFKLQDINATGDYVVNPDAVMVDRSPKTDQQLLNITYHYELLTTLMIEERMNKPAMAKANKLIGLLKKEYHLK